MHCNRWNEPSPNIADLIGKTFNAVTQDGEEMRFLMEDGTGYLFHHHSNCCEQVGIEDIEGDLTDLIGSPITMAEEINSDDAPAPENAYSYTWTFYKFATVKGYVTVRWLGESNGYYSESVNFCRL